MSILASLSAKCVSIRKMPANRRFQIRGLQVIILIGAHIAALAGSHRGVPGNLSLLIRMKYVSVMTWISTLIQPIGIQPIGEPPVMFGESAVNLLVTAGELIGARSGNLKPFAVVSPHNFHIPDEYEKRIRTNEQHRCTKLTLMKPSIIAHISIGMAGMEKYYMSF
ncbi:hypothetical protein HAX54_028713, partial [Datura stramonium]|nr:hypothetical protein [Datura stramonium]